MSVTDGAVLLVVGRPAPAAALPERLTALTGAPPERAHSPAGALARAGQGGLAAVLLEATARGVTPALVAALAATGARVAVLADAPAAVDPAFTAAGALILPITPPPDAGTLRALIRPAATGAAPLQTGQSAAADRTPPPAAWPARPGAVIPPLPAPPEPAAPRPYARRLALRHGATDDAGAALPDPTLASPPPRDAAVTARRSPDGGVPAGRIVGILGTRGGDGGTLVAHALADALAEAGQPVLLLDVDAAGDRLVPLLGLAAPGAGLAALALAGPLGTDVWRAALDAELRPIGPCLLALPGLERPSAAALLTDGLVAALLAEARRRAAWVVVDLGRWSPLPWQRAARLACDELLVALAPTGAGVEAARATLRELADEPAGPAVALLRTRADRPGAFPAAEVATALGRPTLAAVPEDPATVAWAAAQQLPVTRAPGRLAPAVRALAAALAARAGAAAPVPAAPLRARRHRQERHPALARLAPAALLAGLRARLVARPRGTAGRPAGAVPRPKEASRDPA
ncbi:MAG: hypothetical protein IT340_16600 [Chloroflexi bacterium]|nr:hypothetical protein [Chloroflexota bacterium]